MKKMIGSIAVALALAFAALPLSACGKNTDEADREEDTEITIPVGGENTPEETPEVPETPSAPSEPEQGEGENPAPPEENPEEEPPDEEVPEEPETPQPAQATYIMITTDGLNIRSGAGANYSVVAQAENGTLLQYGGTTGDWHKTYYKNTVAYVSAKSSYTKLVTMDAGSDDVEAVIEEGLKLLGTVYVYGAVRYHDGLGNLVYGFTNKAFDCSSLMQYMFYNGANVLLNVTSRTQSVQGTSVNKANLQRGDLMFFTNATRYNYTGIDRIGHVGLYLGDNYILHTASDFAKIEQISATRWSYFIKAQRMI